MSKKKSANKQQTGETKLDTRNYDEIIVLNNGEVEEEEETMNVLGTTPGNDDEVIDIDTSFLDEELGITDAFKEMQVDIRPIGKNNQEKGENKEDKKEKKEHKKNKDKKSDKKNKDQNDDDKEFSKKVLNTFTMVLRGEDFEPIPYPFGDNESVYDLTFEKCVELVDHMAVARFIKHNPTFTLKDAFRQVFTVNDDVEDIVDDTFEQDAEEDLFMNELVKKYIDEVETALERLIDVGDEEPEVVAKELEIVGNEIDKTSIGRLMERIIGKKASEIIRARINGDKIECDDMEKAFENVMSRIPDSDIDEINKLVNENKIDIGEAVERVIEAIEPVSNKEHHDNDLSVDSNETELQRIERQLQKDLERISQSQKLFNKAMAFPKGLIARAGLTA